MSFSDFQFRQKNPNSAKGVDTSDCFHMISFAEMSGTDGNISFYANRLLSGRQ